MAIRREDAMWGEAKSRTAPETGVATAQLSKS
jgi:hypothetical protein